MGKYLKSSQVKVFPSAFRGKDADDKQYDPGSFLTLEKNYADVTNKVTNRIKNYTYFNNDEINIIIGGYYFIVSDYHNITNQFEGSNNAIIYATISTGTLALPNSDETTKVLSPDGGTAGEIIDRGDSEQEFKALIFATDISASDQNRLPLFSWNGSSWTPIEESTLNISANQVKDESSHKPISQYLSTSTVSATSVFASTIRHAGSMTLSSPSINVSANNINVSNVSIFGNIDVVGYQTTFSGVYAGISTSTVNVYAGNSINVSATSGNYAFSHNLDVVASSGLTVAAINGPLSFNSPNNSITMNTPKVYAKDIYPSTASGPAYNIGASVSTSRFKSAYFAYTDTYSIYASSVTANHISTFSILTSIIYFMDSAYINFGSGNIYAYGPNGIDISSPNNVMHGRTTIKDGNYISINNVSSIYTTGVSSINLTATSSASFYGKDVYVSASNNLSLYATKSASFYGKDIYLSASNNLSLYAGSNLSIVASGNVSLSAVGKTISLYASSIQFTGSCTFNSSIKFTGSCAFTSNVSISANDITLSGTNITLSAYASKTKLTRDSVGSSNRLIYLNNGVPTAGLEFKQGTLIIDKSIPTPPEYDFGEDIGCHIGTNGQIITEMTGWEAVGAVAGSGVGETKFHITYTLIGNVLKLSIINWSNHVFGTNMVVRFKWDYLAQECVGRRFNTTKRDYTTCVATPRVNHTFNAAEYPEKLFTAETYRDDTYLYVWLPNGSECEGVCIDVTFCVTN